MPARLRGRATAAKSPPGTRGPGALPRRAGRAPAPTDAAPRGGARLRQPALPAVQGPTPPMDLFHKTRLCRFHDLSLCARGAECSFAHGQGELQTMPDLTRTRLCQDLIRTGMCNNNRCAFAHNGTELRPRPSKKSILAARASRAAEAPATRHCCRAVSLTSPGALGIAGVAAARAAAQQQPSAARGRRGEVAHLQGPGALGAAGGVPQEKVPWRGGQTPSRTPSDRPLGEAACAPRRLDRGGSSPAASTATGGELTPLESWPSGPWQWAGQQRTPAADPEAHREGDGEGTDDPADGAPGMEIGVKNTFVHVTSTPTSLRRSRSWPDSFS
ncbi:unnamed protein product [Prorocentrum cordatum]|uniref:C3H1-type domain-containing protein n=1 Tax=Prorocentrum cordatum TaxID=2364126 RepID=A0ABN9VGJ2_9DINO|nr:unnamed protein product [Polarella glacialis]